MTAPLSPDVEAAIETIWVHRHHLRAEGMADLSEIMRNRPAEIRERQEEAGNEALQRHLNALRAAIQHEVAEAVKREREAGEADRLRLDWLIGRCRVSKENGPAEVTLSLVYYPDDFDSLRYAIDGFMIQDAIDNGTLDSDAPSVVADPEPESL